MTEARSQPEVARAPSAHRWLEPLAVLAVALLGLSQCWIPLDGDQAFFLHAARLLDAGGALYRDVWDVKQPGIFLFYEAAGRLTGFSDFSVHLLEALWL